MTAAKSNLVHFSLGFSVNGRWKALAEELRLENYNIRFYDGRTQNPADRVLRDWEVKGGSTEETCMAI